MKKPGSANLPGFLHGSNNANDERGKAPLRLLGLAWIE